MTFLYKSVNFISENEMCVDDENKKVLQIYFKMFADIMTLSIKLKKNNFWLL